MKVRLKLSKSLTEKPKLTKITLENLNVFLLGIYIAYDTNEMIKIYIECKEYGLSKECWPE